MINGISRGSRPICRTQPQLRLDCSQAISCFSQSDDIDTALGEEQRCRDADDAAADDDDIGAAGKLFGGDDAVRLRHCGGSAAAKLISSNR